jgi:hypothetical protein
MLKEVGYIIAISELANGFWWNLGSGAYSEWCHANIILVYSYNITTTVHRNLTIF